MQVVLATDTNLFILKPSSISVVNLHDLLRIVFASSEIVLHIFVML